MIQPTRFRQFLKTTDGNIDRIPHIWGRNSDNQSNWTAESLKSTENHSRAPFENRDPGKSEASGLLYKFGE